VRRLFAIGFLAFSAASCSLLVSLDGFNDGSAEPDASTDGPHAEDASGDSIGEARVADASAFACDALVPAPKFCDDFERPTPTGTMWSSLNITLGATVTIDSTDSRSPTRSLNCVTPALDAGTPVASLSRSFPDIATDIRYSFDLKIAAPAVVGQIDLATVRLKAPDAGANATMSVTLSVRPNQTLLMEEDYRFDAGQPSFKSHGFGREPVFGQWERVVIHIVLAPTPHINVQLGEDTVIDTDFSSPGMVPSRIDNVVAGIKFTSLTGADIHIDNLVIDY
jgi:hypothetical protein